ncbi:hypothetical protein I79_016591 [Cricetulus griseus]|uniref:Uncharacterized protein n=1 Tax=Cricetulus griseus TaxID=10029 RepID=G3HZS7_CRIGR|nr:hypothetical protein I79_016591 [Cricetulus griseus]
MLAAASLFLEKSYELPDGQNIITLARTNSAARKCSSSFPFWVWNIIVHMNLPSILSLSVTLKYQQRHWRCWSMPLISELGRQRQADLCEFKTSLVYKS